MACKYIYEGVTYNSKEEFIAKVVQPKYGTLANVDQTLKAKGVSKEDAQKLTVPQNQFLHLLGRDNNWQTFFVKSIIQDSAKKGYEKVLFPSGNTASKVEGLDTLEEFKKQKEDRIKELEEKKVTLKDKIQKEYDDAQKDRVSKYFYFEEYGSKTVEQRFDNENSGIESEIIILKQELERVETEGFGALNSVYNFYENTVANILKKQGYAPKQITDEYGNTWYEITINQARDLSEVLLQRNEANQIIGQANIKAMSVLVDAVNQKQDTLPHEYAHHYIAWYRNTPIVQEAIKKWGSEEALVQSIGEQVVKQKGEAYNWWKKFVEWIMNQFNSLSKLQKEELTQILTDAFLTRQDLSSGQSQIGGGVDELFESNPELANAVYEALGFEGNTIESDSNKIITPEQKQQAQQLYSQYLDTKNRLYRSETYLSADERKAPDWLKEQPEYIAQQEAQGRWFYKSLQEAQEHLKKFEGNEITYVDVAEDIEQYNAKNNKFAGGYGRQGKEYFVPKEIASSRNKLGSEKDIEDFRQWMQSQTDKDATALDNLISKLEQLGIIEKDCRGGGIKAKDGIRSKFTRGSQWELVKDLKGYPSHAQGGVDIQLGKDGFSFSRGESQVLAAHGLVLPKTK